jgi:hypothetical protein
MILWIRAASRLLMAVALVIPTTATAASPSPSPSPAPSSAPGSVIDPLFELVAPEGIPFTYRCDGVPFTASDLAYGAPPLDPPFGPLPGWRVLGQERRFGQLVSLTEPGWEEAPLRSRLFELTEDGAAWSFAGDSTFDCAPWAYLPHARAVAGFWELWRAGRPPEPSDTSFEIRVWDSQACRGGTRVLGEPRVHLTDDVVLVAVAVRELPGGDSCPRGGPVRATVSLPEPLGDRAVVDAGHLPLRVVVGSCLPVSAAPPTSDRCRSPGSLRDGDFDAAARALGVPDDAEIVRFVADGDRQLVEVTYRDSDGRIHTLRSGAEPVETPATG